MSHRTSVVAAFFVCALLALMCSVSTASASSVIRGVDDLGLGGKTAKADASRISFLATKLHAGLVRVDVRWANVEPRRGVYDQAYLTELQNRIQLAAGDGLQVIVTLYGTPAWASDHSLWGYAPPSYAKGVYHSFYPPAANRLPDFQAFATKLASTFVGDVTGYECRNEPNLWSSIYPQRTATDAAFGVRRYAAMLTVFSAGIHAGDPHALVIAGATGPTGLDNALSTDPIRFAKLLRGLVSSSVFDAYSHHPYAVGGTSRVAPEDMPEYPRRQVNLANIGALLKIFPGKPFYLTEYGYYTQYSLSFGIWVSEPTQASYLIRAYRFAARFPQIKALVWFPYHDSSGANELFGAYSGLVTMAGAYKPSWFAFSGDNTLALTAAHKGGGSFRLAGKLTTSLGGLAGKSLTVSRRLPGGKWRVVKTVKTGTGGAYHLWVKVTGRAWFRLAWPGVVHSNTVEADA